MESGFVDGNRVLRADMIFKILLWQNDASEETIEKALESVKTGNALHFKGLRIRQAGGALHANGRLNKAEFEIVALREEEALSVALAQ